MENRNSKLKAFIIAGIILLTALALALIVTGSKSGQTGKVQSSGKQPAAGAESAETDIADSDPLAVLFCTADYQMEKEWGKPADNMKAILRSVIAAGKIPEGVIVCGDYTNDRNYHDYQLSPDESIAEIRDLVESVIPGWDENHMIIFEQGNHDAMTDQITPSGLHEYDDYLVYVINTENDFPWKQGKASGCLKKVREASAELDSCFAELDEKGEKRPVIIAGHVPLHYTARTSSKHSTGDNLYASVLFNAINKYGDRLNIIFLYGHNHTKGWDCYLGGSSVFKAKGSTILVPQFNETDVNSDKYKKETLKFTYLNAGYTGYYMNCGPVQLDNGTWRDYICADTALTGTVLEIYADRIVISRWDAEGMHDLGSKGEGDPYKGGIDLGLIPHTEYSETVTSPQSVTRY